MQPRIDGPVAAKRRWMRGPRSRYGRTSRGPCQPRRPLALRHGATSPGQAALRRKLPGQWDQLGHGKRSLRMPEGERSPRRPGSGSLRHWQPGLRGGPVVPAALFTACPPLAAPCASPSSVSCVPAVPHQNRERPCSLLEAVGACASTFASWDPKIRSSSSRVTFKLPPAAHVAARPGVYAATRK